MKTRAITEGALMAAITVIIALLSYFIPFFSILSYFLLSVPTIILYKRYGLIVAAASAVSGSLILLIFMDPLNALIYGLTIILPGLVIGYSYAQNESGGVRIIYAYFAFLGVILIEMILFERITGTNILESFISDINESVKQIDNFYQASGRFDQTELTQLTESINEQAQALKMLFPTIIVVSPAVLSWVTILFDDYFFKRTKETYRPLTPITEWHLPNIAKGILALVAFVSVIAQRVITDQAFSLYPYTAVTIVNLIFLVMGISFIFWLIKRRFHKNSYILRVIVLILIAIFPGLSFIVTVVGIFDIYIDLRRFFVRQR